MSRAYGEAAAREIALLQWAESTPVGDLWNADDARWATALARASGPQRDFRRERARFAAKRLGERDERLLAFTRRPLWSGSWPGRALLLGLILGVGVERLGGAQLNLLALPLWGVLALQLIGYLVLMLGRGRTLPLAGLWQRWIAGRANQDHSERMASLSALWLQLSRPLQLARGALLWHALLLGLSVGMVMGLYARGLQREYVIGWESTFLETAQVQRLADTVLAPAAFFSGVPVPDVAPLRHGAGQAPRGPARDWLHLLAVTVLLVALPRAALAASGAIRAGRLARALPLPLGRGPRDLRLAVIDPSARLAGSLLGDSGERLSSPEGDRLLVQRLDAAPVPERTPWWRSPPPPAHDLVVDAAALPAGGPGWLAQRRQLQALAVPAALQPAWERLIATWQAAQAQREQQALDLLSTTLTALSTLRVELPAGADPASAAPAALQQALQAPLDELAQALYRLYGSAPAGEPPQALDGHQQLQLPLPAGRNALLGGVAGGVASGALVGLKADLASGGLSLGAGALTGAVLGGLGAAGLTDWLNRRLDRQTASLSLDAAALPGLAQAVLLRWLGAIPHPVAPARLEAVIAAQQWEAPLATPLARAMEALRAENGTSAQT